MSSSTFAKRLLQASQAIDAASTPVIAAKSKLWELGYAAAQEDADLWDQIQGMVAKRIRDAYGDKALKRLELRLQGVPRGALVKLADAATEKSRSGDEIILRILKKYKIPGMMIDFLAYLIDCVNNPEGKKKGMKTHETPVKKPRRPPPRR